MSALDFTDLDHLEAYKKLQATKATFGPAWLRANLSADAVSAKQVAYDLGGHEKLAYNYAAKFADTATLGLLQALADQARVKDKFVALASGAWMNTGEKRMVLHHLTRGQLGTDVLHEGQNLRAFYQEQQNRIAEFALKVHAGTVAGTTGQRFTTVVQVGIGGSDLGPRALHLALKNYMAASRKEGLRGRGEQMTAHFMSNVDPDDAADVLRHLDAERTLFILVSKSGTTQETLTNEAFVLQWLAGKGISAPKKHIICVTSEASPLAKSRDYLDSFFIDDFIGGRYSSTSAVGGAVLSLAFGPDVFQDILDGAAAVDRQAMEGDIIKNPALLDALLGVYERNVLGYPSTAILPYSQALSRFPAHLQQADMESNGKQVNRDGKPLAYATGPVIFGEPGTNGQHSFYQLLHQGTDVVPLQFIGFQESQDGLDTTFQGSTSQKKLNANLVAQIVAFALGKDDANPNKNFPGGRPSSLLWAKRLSPRVLGALLAHFENKIMFQGFVWNLNSFDQEGVQLGKVLANKVLDGKTEGALKAFDALMG